MTDYDQRFSFSGGTSDGLFDGAGSLSGVISGCGASFGLSGWEGFISGPCGDGGHSGVIFSWFIVSDFPVKDRVSLAAFT